MPLAETNELIWFSERSGWAHLYLYDLNTGKLKGAITEGEWLVRNVLHYDIEKREIILQTAARDKAISPYYRDICKVNIDTKNITPIMSGCYDHCVYQPFSFIVSMHEALGLEGEGVSGVSGCGNYLVATRSRVDSIPVSVLVDRNGREILVLEMADVSNLPDGWQWPESVKLTGADGTTDIYGVILRPQGFSESGSYPVIEFSCSQRGMSTLFQGAFVNTVFAGMDYLLAQALASLGFIVVLIEGRGTPLREKSFQDYHYGDLLYANNFEDRISGIRQLAERYSYMDIDRVGITGHENQTNNIYALLQYSDFYKVAVVNCIFDPRFNIASLGEVYDGTENSDESETRYAEDCIENFGGKLLLIQGMLSYTTPAGMFRLVKALQKANKDFEMLCLPNLIHEMTSYTIRREWDFLVKHLQDINPPFEYKLKTGKDILGL